MTTTPKAFSRNLELAAPSEFVRVGLGLHPQLVQDRADELKLLESLLPQARYIGEVGLDAGPRYYRSFKLQQKIFRRMVWRAQRAMEAITGKIELVPAKKTRQRHLVAKLDLTGERLALLMQQAAVGKVSRLVRDLAWPDA